MILDFTRRLYIIKHSDSEQNGQVKRKAAGDKRRGNGQATGNVTEHRGGGARASRRGVDAMTVGEIRGAGAVVWRWASAAEARVEIEVLLVHRTKVRKADRGTGQPATGDGQREAKLDWSFPKGKLPSAEKGARRRHPMRTAVREVRQETGLEIRLGRHLGTAEYRTKAHPKAFLYWAADVVKDHGFTHNEVDEIKWMPLAEARRALTFVSDQKLLDVLEKTTLPTAPVILLRGASSSAVQQPSGDGDPDLDQRDARDARSLAKLLRCFGTLPVLTSDASHCMRTVAPYAKHTNAPISVREELSCSGFDPEVASRIVREHIRQGSGAIVCSHHEELPQLARRIFGMGVLGDPLGAAPPLKPAEFLIFHTHQDQVVAWERSSPKWNASK